jgi:hypothetical protein
VAEGAGAQAAGLTLYQLSHGPAARLSVRSEGGRSYAVRSLEGEGQGRGLLRVPFPPRQQEQVVVAPAADLLIRMVHYDSVPAQGISGRALQLEAARWSDGEPLGEWFLDDSGVVSVAATAGPLQLQVAFEYYVVVRAEGEPDVALAAAGGVALLLGLLSAARWPRRRVWIALRAHGDGVACHLEVARGDAEAEWFACLRRLLQSGKSGMRVGEGAT